MGTGARQPRFLKENFSFSGLQWFFWSAFGVLIEFLVLFMRRNGLEDIYIGTVMSVVSFAGIIGQPVLGYLCDRTHAIKQVITICLVLSGGLALLFPAVVSVYGMLLILAACVAFVLQSVPPLIDSWTIKLKEKKPRVNYGLTRAFGSIGFAVTVSIVGVLVDLFSINIVFFVHVGLALMVVVFVQTVKNPEELQSKKLKTATDRPDREMPRYGHPAEKPREGTGAETDTNPFALFRNGELVFFLLITLVIFTVFRACMVYLPILIEELGGSGKTLGFSLAMMAMCEVPILIISAWLLKKVKDVNLIIIAFCFFTLRAFLYYIVKSPNGIIAIQAAQLGSFALFLPASIHYVHRIARPELRTTALTLSSVFSFGLGSIFGSMLGGIMLQYMSIFSIYKIGTIVSAVAVGVYIVGMKVVKRSLPMNKRR